MGDTVVVGHKYFMGIHFGICHGPVDALEAITAGEKLAWSGNVTASGQFQIYNPELFGGEKMEGGLHGTATVMMGASDQAKNSYLQSKLGANVPAYRGIFSLLYGGMISCNLPYLKPWGFRVKRITKGWHNDNVWYSAKAEIGSGDMNPAHIIYQCLTDPEWGMGYSTNTIDSANFQAAADQLYTEGFGLSLQWNKPDSVKNFINFVLQHISGTVRLDTITGKFQLKLIRDDYDPDALTVLDESNVIELENWERLTWGETINEINLVYTSPTNYRPSVITVHDIANINAQGALVSSTIQMPGIKNDTLAKLVAERELVARATPVSKMRARINRIGFTMQPGDVFRLQWQKLGVDTVYRVLSINYGTLTEGAITIDAVEDVFAMPDSTYIEQEPIGWVDPISNPVASPYRVITEVPYWALARSLSSLDLALVDQTYTYLAVMASPPADDSYGYNLWTAIDPDDPVKRSSNQPHTRTCVTTESLSLSDTTVSVSGLPDPDRYPLRAGTFIQIDDEMMGLVSVDYDLSTLTVKRAVLDTVPDTHANGARIYLVMDTTAGRDKITYLEGDIVNVQVQTVTGGGALDIGSAPVDTYTMRNRQGRPYNAACVKIGGAGELFPEYFEGALSATWRSRNKEQQTVSLISWFDDTVGNDVFGDPTQTYTVRVYDPDNVMIWEDDAVAYSATSWTFQPSDEYGENPDGTYYNQLTFEIVAVHNGLESWQAFRHTAYRAGYGLNYGLYYGAGVT